jgi:hypothetical protein
MSEPVAHRRPRRYVDEAEVKEQSGDPGKYKKDMAQEDGQEALFGADMETPE